MIDIGLDAMTLELILRLFASVALGALVGLEREITRKPAGLRTHVLVSMGACLFTMASFYMIPSGTPGADYGRIAAGIVTGIGFIGAGSVIATRGRVSGITTAASLWIVAAIGLVIGMGNYILSLAAAVLAFLILRVGKVEREIEYGTEEKREEDKEEPKGVKIELNLPKGFKIEKHE